MRKLIGVYLLCFLFSFSSSAFAATPRGVVTGENAESFVILRDGEQMPCQKGEFLYDGDIIKGTDVAGLSVEWHPYAKMKLNGPNEMKVAYEAPGTLDAAIYKMKEFLGLVDSEVTLQYGATRGKTAQEKNNAPVPLPGFSATLLPDETVLFTWGDASGKKLTVKDETGSLIKSVDVSGRTEIEINAEQIGLKHGTVYNWQVEGLKGRYALSLLDEENATKIKKDLRQIDQTEKGENERRLQRAAYLQLASDALPGKVELYWLSYLELSRIEAGEDLLLKAKAERLKNNVADHIGNMR